MTGKKINKVTIRMYCLGTGDCFVLKFYANKTPKFTMMIDCGSCIGKAEDFKPYINNLKDYVGTSGIDLLVITHEHQDHINGFHKCRDIFKDIKIKKAWFGWTEDLEDKEGRAAELLKKRSKMRFAFSNAMKQFILHKSEIEENFEGDYNLNNIRKANEEFLLGLNTLAEINLSVDDESGIKESLAGMKAIREKLKNEEVDPEYLNPGEIKTLDVAPGLKFYVLGPPNERDSIFKNGKEGSDIYKKYFALNQSTLFSNAFSKDDDDSLKNDLPFDTHFIENRSLDELEKSVNMNEYETRVKELVKNYHEKDSWRKIDYDWFASLGSLALRLNSHINNTSLVLAIESSETGNVLLFPGDAEYGNWESWHLIKDWDKKGKDGKHLVEDLLNRTIFYKCGHHLSYNGTALQKGIEMMPASGMAAMVSLDRTRISSKWKSTMPNKFLLQDLIKRCNGKVFFMSEEDIQNPPSAKVNPQHITGYKVDKLYKQYTMNI